ncbi:SDR family NAD(P)-dependent oxidoreductase [Cryobacterium sp. PH29-G1]|uniref:SDR family NAD(P)-dependent oxidoreductase n=1 Tax=Cryobacterium sp. PH29-G1 TaxID=3046211 RepID=UPI0024BA3611|nr:SDR family NAD(P)-dependent oxidoreductase [Cryobacterium sp. PH29-G1]MDJ0349670.1 SDR family NAD(P)-dependent oxidoreductase [Cryobacterium sp. PH29-G1]
MTKTIIITGASDGIGAAAARRLSADGHRIVVVGRSDSKTADIAKEIGAKHYVADFADLSQVRGLADDLLAAYPSIDVLANNAGGIMGARTLTVDGHEMTFQVNHLAPFLLTTLLMPSLVAGKATVIQTASLAARIYGKFDIDDLQNAHDYAPQTAYGNAKLANILFTRELQRRYADQGLSAVSFHPGVVGTSFANDTTHVMRFLYHGPLKRMLTITADKGADQLVWLAEGIPGTTFEPGGYYESKKLAKKVNPDANDAILARLLWERSAALV